MAKFCNYRHCSIRNCNVAVFALILAVSCATLISGHVGAAVDTVTATSLATVGRRRALNYVYSYPGGSHGHSRPSDGDYYSTSSTSFGGSYGSSPSKGGGCSHGDSSSPSNVDSYGSSGGSYASSSTSYGYGYGSGSFNPSNGGGSYGKGTPKYWLGHPKLVPNFLSLTSHIVNIFGQRILNGLEDKAIGPSISELTIFGALKDESTKHTMTWLVREGSAAYINSYAYAGEFPLPPSEVVSRLNDALDSPELAKRQAIQFQEFNENV